LGFLSDNFIADFFVKALDWIQSFVGSYGWSIVLLTIFFKLALLPLDIKQKKGMRMQKKLQPEIDKINKKYANDKEMQSKKTMEFYKQSGYSPFSGCLPMLIQLPIFFAFFGALRAIAGEQILAVYEAAQTMPLDQIPIEGWLWVKNLWQPDVFALMEGFPKNTTVIPLFEQVQAYKVIVDAGITNFDTVLAPLREMYEGVMNGWWILPIAAGGMSFLQGKLTMPTTTPAAGADNKNPMSGKMMTYLLPLFSVFICVTSSAAFALYWTVSNIVSVVTNIVVEKVLNAKEHAAQENA
jgi:YidC/Oxa1 family membrane protein insertase